MAAEDPETGAALPPVPERPIRAAEVVGALSLATDLGTGQPLEHTLRTAVLAIRLGELADRALRRERLDRRGVGAGYRWECGNVHGLRLGLATCGATVT